MEIEPFYDLKTSTFTYLVYDPASRDAVVIDPVMDYDPASSSTSRESAEQVISRIRARNLRLGMILETHAHADHLSGSQLMKTAFPGTPIAIGKRITEVQAIFKKVFDLPEDFPTDGRQFDRLLGDNEVVRVGSLTFQVLFTPGHTPACACYLFEGAVFSGDALFMPDMGTGRCDFPAGSASDLYDSIVGRLYELPEETRVLVGHDYQPGGRDVLGETTIGEEKRHNIHLPMGRAKEDFVAFRTKRDATLDTPKLLFQSVQVNVDAGALPAPRDNQVRYLKIPVNVFKPSGPGDLETRATPPNENA
jgi:glyoxylase-like metal-dependent hydrolase (beta-lactamase superfamily II)